MPSSDRVKVGLIRKNELSEADRIFRVAFGTFIGLPNPAEFMGDRDMLISRWHGWHVEVLAARQGGRLIGTNVVTRWGSFGFFGPLTILPEFWDRGVAQLLLQATDKIFDKKGLKRTGLFTFAASPKHVGLYQKFGYWPGYLTALMAHTPKADTQQTARGVAVHLSTLTKSRCEEAIASCSRLTGRIDKGLDLSGEIVSLLKKKKGEVVLTRWTGLRSASTGRGRRAEPRRATSNSQRRGAELGQENGLTGCSTAAMNLHSRGEHRSKPG